MDTKFRQRRRRLLLAFGVACLALCSSFLILLHHHHHADSASRADCPACIWQSSGFYLLHSEIILLWIAPIAFLRRLRVRLPVCTLPILLRTIRGPPDPLT